MRSQPRQLSTTVASALALALLLFIPATLPAATIYYVNDNSTSNDLWCSAVGDDFNSGLAPSAPKATVQALLSTYTISKGDVVRIDTGLYNLTSDIILSNVNSGVSTALLNFVASPYGVTINRGDIYKPCFILDGANYVQFSTATDNSLPGVPQRWAQLTGGGYGWWSRGHNNRLMRTEVVSNYYYQVLINVIPASNNIVANCLLRDTLDPSAGAHVRLGSTRNTIANCTLAGSTRNAVQLVNATLAWLENNIYSLSGAGNYAINLNSGSTLSGSDFSLFSISNNANLAIVNTTIYPTLAAWRSGTGRDTSGLAYDPLFVDPANGDYHLQSTAGSYHGGAFTADAGDSPGIDTGTGPVGTESVPNQTPLQPANSGKCNRGAYGGTEQASRTPHVRAAYLYSPLASEQYLNQAIPLNVRWTWIGTAWSNGNQTVALDYLDPNGTPTAISGASSLMVTNGSYNWSIAGLLPTPIYQLRITRNIDSNLVANSGNFRIGRNAVYYVNDANTSNDLWSAAIGNDANTGLYSNAPRATVQSVLDTYPLIGGDQVRIDTGTYVLTNDIIIPSTDSGTSASLVSLIASPYGVTLDRNDIYGSCIKVNGAAFTQVTTTNDSSLVGIPQSWLRLTGGGFGWWCTGPGNQISRVEAVSNQSFGVLILGGNPVSNNIVANCLFRDTLDPGAGTHIKLGSTKTTVQNCTFAGQSRYNLHLASATLAYLQNNIFTASGTGNYALYQDANSTLSGSDNNLFHVTSSANAALLGITAHSTLAAWRAASGRDTSSLDRDPLFVSTAAGDYHLQSTAGSYHGGAFTADASDSPGIDAGYGGVGAETPPNQTPLHPANAGKCNLGAYGGTEQASRTPHARHIFLYAPLANEQYLNQASPLTVRWTWMGTAWSNGNQTVALSYLDPNGVPTAISGASNLTVTTGTFNWSIAGLLPTPIYQLHVTRNIDSNLVANSGNFRIGRNTVYYINDANTSNDLWSAAIGNDANTGLYSNAPRATVQSILDTYPLIGGDQVRIDTGLYNLAGDITVSNTHSGNSADLVSFVASPYGVTINRGDIYGASFWMRGATYTHVTTTNDSTLAGVPQRWMQLTGGGFGWWSSGAGNRLTRVEAVSNQSYGAIINGGIGVSNNIVANCLFRDELDTAAGAHVYLGGSRTTVANCTLAGKAKYGLRQVSAALTYLENNIFTANGTNNVAVRSESGSTFSGSNYNLFSITNGATLATLNATNYATLATWRTATGRDTSSLELNPLFVNPTTGDYHLQSTAGSYHGGAFTADAADSPGIDTGYGDVGLETAPSQTPLHPSTTGKINLGTYGGTEQASRTSTNRYLYFYEPIGTETYPVSGGPINVRWTWVGTGWTNGNTVALEYRNSTVSFTNVTGGAALAVTNGTYAWDVAGLVRENGYQLRLTANQPPSLSITTKTTFSIGGKFLLYVNDASLANDTWCTAVGNDANDGAAINRPKASLPSLLGAYDLQPGDEIRIDTGTYNLSSNLVIDASDSGAGINPVHVYGSTAGATILNRGNTNGTTAVIDCQATGLSFNALRLTGGARGFVHNGTASSNVLADCFIYGNARGIQAASTGALLVVNSTVADNSLAGIDATGATNTPTIVNTILWNTTNDLIACQATYSDIKSGDAGAGNFSALPQFINPATGDYRLLAASPCIDAGTNAVSLLPSSDIEGQARTSGSFVDVGADERLWTVSLISSNNSVAEHPSSTTTLTALRDGAYAQTMAFSITISGTASNGVDYSLIPATIVISNGSTTGSLTFTPTADALLEGNEVATFTLTSTNTYVISSTNSASITIDESTDLATTQTGPAMVGPTATMAYTVTLTNAGLAAALNINVHDTLPPDATFVSASAGGYTNAGIVYWPPLASLNAGTATNFTLTITAPPGGLLTNVVASTTSTADPNPSNNNGSESNAIVVTLVADSADVIATQTGPANVEAIAPVLYTIIVSNTGPSTALNVTITDPLPAGATFVSATGGGTNASGTIGWPLIAALPANTATTLTLTVTAPAQGTLTNTITSASTTIDPFPANNNGTAPEARVITTINPRADVVLTKSASATIAAGTNLTYTITVTNGGPSIATGISVLDTLPTNVTFVSASAGGTNAASQVGWPALAALSAGAVTNFTVTVFTPPTGSLTNTVTGTASTTDPNTTNNTAAAITLVVEQADIIATKTGPVSVTATTNFTYTILVTNAGPSTANNIAILDTLPALATFIGASAGGTNAGNLVGWPLIPSLAGGQSTSLTVEVTAPSNAATLTNVIASTAATADPVATNNNGSAPAARVLTTVIPFADILTTKGGPTLFNAGSNLTYTITLTNRGPSTATGISVLDTLPTNVTFVSASAAGTNAAGQVGWPALVIPAGATTNLFVTILAPPTGTVTNTVASTAVTDDPVATNNTAAAITLIIEQADIITTKTGPATVVQSSNILYTITVTNAGPSDASNVAVLDTLPSLVTFVSASAGGTNVAGQIGWPVIPNLPSGQSTALTVNVTAPTNFVALTNIVASTATTADPFAFNNNGSLPGARVITLVVFLDSDSDGMPDDWETMHGLDPHNAADATLDADGDGMTNLQEFLAGTDPQNAVDVLTITEVFQVGDDIHVRFTSVAGRTYLLQYRDSFETGNWTDLPPTVPGTGAVIELTNVNGALQPGRYYRIRLVLP